MYKENTNNILINNDWKKYLVLSIFMFIIILLEKYVSIPITIAITGKTMPEWQGSDGILCWFITILIWGIGSFVALKYSMKRLSFSPFEYNIKPEIKNVLIGILIVFVFALIQTYVYWKGFKPIIEFNGHIGRFGKFGTLTFIIQYLYYFFEMIVATSILIYSQKVGEILIGKINIPWGGIFVGFTWGLNHIFTQGSVSIGIFSFFTGLAFGIIYILEKKNLLYAYPLIFLTFVL